MSAADELPRGFDLFDSAAANIAAAITIPACPGVTPVVTAISVYALCIASAAFTMPLSVTANGNTVGYMVLNAQTGTAGSYDDVATLTWTGEIVGTHGAAMTIIVSGNNFAVYQTLEVQGYFI